MTQTIPVWEHLREIEHGQFSISVPERDFHSYTPISPNALVNRWHTRQKEQGFVKGVLKNSEYCLTVPLSYDISEGDEGWSGYVHHLDLPAYGDTKKEVLDDLHRAIVEYYEILCQQSEEDLGNLPKIHKIILSGIIG